MQNESTTTPKINNNRQQTNIKTKQKYEDKRNQPDQPIRKLDAQM